MALGGRAPDLRAARIRVTTTRSLTPISRKSTIRRSTARPNERAVHCRKARPWLTPRALARGALSSCDYGSDPRSIMAKQDYYETLGVGKTASADELRQAFRKLAMQHHPDRNSGD